MKKLMVSVIGKSHAGVTSLIVVIAIGLILSGIVAGVAALSIREIRQASNTEQSRKALDAAESALRFAAQKISTNPNYTVNACPLSSDPTNGADYDNLFPATGGTGQSITCVEVAKSFTKFQGRLEQDRGQMFMAGSDMNTTTPAYMMLKWHDTKINGVLPNYTKGSFYPPMYADAAAAIEMTFVYWYDGDVRPIIDLTRGNILTSTIFIMPGQEDQGFSSSKGQFRVRSECITNTTPALGDYACRLKPYGTTSPDNKGIKLDKSIVYGSELPPDNIAVIIKPRYLGTNFELQFFDAQGKPITFTSDKYQIDVTAKSGNLYRRVKALVPTTSSLIDNIFDAVIYAGKGADDKSKVDICKKMSVKSDRYLNNMNCPTNKDWQGP